MKFSHAFSWNSSCRSGGVKTAGNEVGWNMLFVEFRHTIPEVWIGTVKHTKELFFFSSYKDPWNPKKTSDLAQIEGI